MPAASKKDCCVILFDLKCKDKALAALMTIYGVNHFTGSKNLTKLILLNSVATKNRMNSSWDGFHHMAEIVGNINSLKPQALMDIILGETESIVGQANFVESLQLGVECLRTEFAEVKGIVTSQLVVLSDLTTLNPGISDEENMADVVTGLSELNAFLYVIGPEIQAPKTIKNCGDINLWMEKLEVDESDYNLGNAKNIVNNIEDGVICNFQMGIHLLFSYKNFGGSQPWNVPLDIGSEVHIPEQAMRVLNSGLKCKLTSMKDDTSETIWIHAEDESVVVPPDEIRKGIMRHGKFVEVAVTKMFHVETMRSFKVLGFTDKANVSEYCMRGDSYYVLPKNPEVPNSLEVLVDCLSELGKYIVARRVYNNNGIPKFVVLVPKPEHDPKCFALAQLPYANEVNVEVKDKPVESAPSTSVTDEASGYLDSINIENKEVDEKMPLSITMMHNCNMLKMVHTALNKDLEKSLNFKNLDIRYYENKSSASSEVLKTNWPERSAEVVTKKAKVDSNESDDDFDW